MARTPALMGLLTGGLLLAAAAPAPAAPTVAQMLTFTPKQKDVSVSTPTAEEQAACKVELDKGSKAGTSGWVLKDGKGRPMRRFFDSTGTNRIDIWSYYKDGEEVYRELDTNGNGKADQYRWLNAGGMKWGVDLNEDGRIDAWRMISAEEAGQEAFGALATHDFDRLKALFISEAEMAAIKLPTTQVQRLAELQKKAVVKFEDVTRALPQLGRATFVRVEGGPPSCVLAEQIGGANDLVHYTSRSLLYEATDAAKNEKKHEWLGTGEMIQVGLAWRLVDVPTAEAAPGASADPGPGGATGANPQLTKLLDALTDIDTKTQGLTGPAFNEQLRRRVQLVLQIRETVEAKEKETWTKQLFDNYATLAQNGDKDALDKLAQQAREVETAARGTSLAAYGKYRELWTRYAVDIGDPKKTPQQIAQVQDKWLDDLAKFVQDYPNAEDTTPEALLQLATGAEFTGKEEEAKVRYKQIYKNFPSHTLAEKARGAEERLGLVGKELKLTGTQLNGTAFDLSALKGKPVVVYYWASYVEQCIGDFARLAAAKKGSFELVCVNLDDSIESAMRFLKTTPVQGTHVFSPPAAKGESGLSSALAVQYGINGLPTMFLVGADGKVVSSRLQLGELESELKKAESK